MAESSSLSKLSAFGGLAGGVAGAGLNFGMSVLANKERAAAEREQLRRFDVGAMREIAGARAAEGASGVVPGQSSMATHIAAMTAEFRRQHDFAAKRIGTGQSLGNLSAGLNLASSLTSDLFRFGDANAWWQKPNAAPSGG